MVDLTEMEKQVFKGTIKEVRELTLREYLTEKFQAKAPKIIKQFIRKVKDEETGETQEVHNLDRDHIVLIIQQDGTEIDWFGLIPRERGWPKSNVKKVKERNNLPSDTQAWVGKEIDLALDTKGFMRVAV